MSNLIKTEEPKNDKIRMFTSKVMYLLYSLLLSGCIAAITVALTIKFIMWLF